MREADVTKLDVDAVANAANTDLKHGGGVAGAIVRAGGRVIQNESDRKAPIGLGEAARSSDTGIGVALRGIEGATILIAKQDPGQGFVWTAFASLIAGLLITFYLPRRRVWVRLAEEDDLAIVGRSDRYVDFTREFGRLLDDIVRIRRADPAGRAAG